MLGNKFDHGAEAIVPVLFNLIPNCAKVMATSGVSAIRIIIRVSFANTSISSFNSLVKMNFVLNWVFFPLFAAHPRPQAHPADNQ